MRLARDALVSTLPSVVPDGRHHLGNFWIMNFRAPPQIRQTPGMECAIWGFISPAGDPVSLAP